MQKKFKKQKGFTLIEVLVALTIFTIFITVISSTYIDIARSQRDTNLIKEIYSETRYLFGIITDEAKSKTIDYGCPANRTIVDDESSSLINVVLSSNSCNELNTMPRERFLALISYDGIERVIFKIEDKADSGDELGMNKIKDIFMYKEKFNGQSWESEAGYESGYQQIELKSMQINGFVFDVTPLIDPFNPDNVGCGPVQFQPSVSIYANVIGSNEAAGNFNFNLQTSISSRAYNQETDL
ncbi:prepilin-type N-terminal cleavage/methylation domain-containing protein [Patescibacteria group bacterium]|nr:prepilin-type N-terminal cleavage/methylation domain-containing protein [Patescibacteria group bacterium]